MALHDCCCERLETHPWCMPAAEDTPGRSGTRKVHAARVRTCMVPADAALQARPQLLRRRARQRCQEARPVPHGIAARQPRVALCDHEVAGGAQAVQRQGDVLDTVAGAAEHHGGLALLCSARAHLPIFASQQAHNKVVSRAGAHKCWCSDLRSKGLDS